MINLPQYPILVDVMATTILTCLLLAIAVADVRTLRIPDSLNLALACVGLTICYTTQRYSVTYLIVSMAITSIALWGIGQLYFRLRGRIGLGLGDVKFAGAAATWIGLEGVPIMMSAASIGAIVFVVVRSSYGAGLAWELKVPFGPFLGLGLMSSWLMGQSLA